MSSGIEVVSTLRRMIVAGEFEQGERLAELPTAERLGVSRTPVRIAFRTLEQEGLLHKLKGRGYCVKEITKGSVAGAIEVRGVLEGLAARQAAEKGLSPNLHSALIECLKVGDAIFDKGYVSEDDLNLYHEINQRFHALILDASGNPAIASSLQKNEHMPFATVNSITFDFDKLKQEYRRFYFAHLQHHTIVHAIANQQASRAEALMREHANVTLNYAEVFSESD
ncbi:GntR family transcriptional regulator [Vibrio sp. EA2]|uniref:GntR family transcriptional regulator n=1 Tax=Vibrio sp. EA2 TaxID=3079860 RepID=UPI0029496B45|nr:GntR family transcriptional regulator [Vibrio sp. EA2]MDV6252291.1 GntR family transcriptional regulator [Vibrio sp. EA2]